jgi:signal transduction histidine kinase
MLFFKYKAILRKSLTVLSNIADSLKIEQDIASLPQQMIGDLVKLVSVDIACYYIKEGQRRYYIKAAGYPDSFWNDKKKADIFVRRYHDELLTGHERKEYFLLKREQLHNLSRNKYKAFDERASCELIIPIEAGGEVVAVIVMSKLAQAVFTQEELEICKIVSSMLTIVYSKWKEQQAQTNQIDFFEEIIKLSPQDMGILFQKYAIALSDILRFKFASLWLYNELDDTLAIRSFYPSSIGSQKVTFQSFDEKIKNCSTSLSGQVIRAKCATTYKTVESLELFSNKRFAKKHGLVSFVSFPILDTEKRPLGILNVWPFDIDNVDTRLQQAISKSAIQLATKIRLASLKEEESFTFAYDVFFEEMTDFKGSRVSWDKLAGLISEQLACEACSIFFKEEDGHLYLKGSTGIIGNPPYEKVSYAPEEGLTGYSFQESKPLIYYFELRSKYRKIHIGKHNEKLKTSSKSKSIIFMQILDGDDRVIGIIRCNNKEETPLKHSGRFTKEDVVRLQKISKLVSSLYSKVRWVQRHEHERWRNVNSLHHEVLSPVGGLMAHIEWIRHNFNRCKSPLDWDLNRLDIKLSDMEQIGTLLEMLVTTMGKVSDKPQVYSDTFSCYALLQTCVSFLINEARRQDVNIKIKSMDLPKVRGDVLQIMRVFYNLFRNGLKYRDSKEDRKFFSVSGKVQGNRVVLEFEDNGIGIVAGEEERIFKEFVRGSNAATVFPEGTGLGLAYSSGIIEQHGGQLFVMPNKLSKPTIIRVELPI